MNSLRLTGCIFISFLPVFFNRILEIDMNTAWYQELVKPDFMPPGWLFAPVWTILYFLIGISLFLFLKEDCSFSKKQWGLLFFTLQLLLNASYTPVAFAQQSLQGGFIICSLLLITILLTIIEFYKVSKKSAYFLIPYIIWVSFATVLSYNLWQINIS